MSSSWTSNLRSSLTDHYQRGRQHWKKEKKKKVQDLRGIQRSFSEYVFKHNNNNQRHDHHEQDILSCWDNNLGGRVVRQLDEEDEDDDDEYQRIGVGRRASTTMPRCLRVSTTHLIICWQLAYLAFIARKS